MTLTTRTAAATRPPESGRDDETALRLYFLYGDPDSRSAYGLERTAPTPAAAAPQ
ncbi:hypothetical protein ACFYZV_41815 [Streptomyces phaeofaciens]|uniref:hypothetical protein n=1 Tax=Streptomyces phaeofaciens TaxID=68254 RepID=UPI00368D1B93